MCFNIFYFTIFVCQSQEFVIFFSYKSYSFFFFPFPFFWRGGGRLNKPYSICLISSCSYFIRYIYTVLGYFQHCILQYGLTKNNHYIASQLCSCSAVQLSSAQCIKCGLIGFELVLFSKFYDQLLVYYLVTMIVSLKYNNNKCNKNSNINIYKEK